uniref:RING-type E3 ubiquitin transferase n=1 Tax=Nelumbo nucifera TaxID=4432 RepID=A0A822XGX8_NELNU|nr:TPA_asm: hypothetical protein HUJ06_020665 [Nelumbo nucifera]
MVILELIPFFFFLLLFSAVDGECPSSVCNKHEPIIRFPFRLTGAQAKNCGYPGLDLSCDMGRTILKLPSSSRQFFVRNINYFMQQIQIYDPSDCLPERLMNLSLSGSPFVGIHYQNYTFMNCPSEFTTSRFTPIPCLSNSTRSVLAITPNSLASMMNSTPCETITTVSVPVSGGYQYESGFSSSLDGDLLLTWVKPNCGDCEVRGGVCSFTNNSSLDVGCFDKGSANQSPKGLQVFKGIVLGIVVPFIMFSICIASYVCAASKCSDSRYNEPQPQHGAVVSPQPTVVVMGLDEPTIQSYNKLVLGESRRLPGPNHRVCSICLSEYQPKETLRCIPECQHCFHADCIDEWLRMNASCPLCRNSPPPPHLILT